MTEIELLQKLKDKLNKEKHYMEDDYNPAYLKNSIKAPFYFDKNSNKNLYDNLIPYSKIDPRYNAVGSSAAFIFNVFGNEGDKFKYDKTELTIKEYEKELEGIIGRNAHLDAYLLGDDKEIFVESKLIEWTKPPKNMYKAYIHKENYKNCETAEIFIPIFESLIIDKIDSEDRYYSKNEKYDAIQMTIHTLAIYNYCKRKENIKQNICLWNIVCDINEADEYKTEQLEAEKYIVAVFPIFEKIFNRININFELSYIPFSKFYEKLEYDDEKHKNYIKRYLLN